MSVNSIENELVILTKQTMDILLKSESPAEAIALYTFYYYTAKWQGTNVPKCTTDYVSNALKWSEAKVRKVKKELLTIGLIEDVQQKDASGKIIGHFVKLNYIVKQSALKENHTYDFPQGGNTHTVESLGTNALSNSNINALSANNKMLTPYDSYESFPLQGKGTKASPTKTDNISQMNDVLSEIGAEWDRDLRYAVIDWLNYKKEKRQQYKPTGLKTLIKTVDKYQKQCGTGAVVNVIENAISSNYMGIMWDKIGNGKKQEQPRPHNRWLDD